MHQNIKKLVGEVYIDGSGGVNDRWEHVLIGEPFQQLSTCNDMCSAGMIVLSKRSFEIMKDHNNKISGRVLHRDSRNKENRNLSMYYCFFSKLSNDNVVII